MQVVKRNGTREEVQLDKISNRIQKLTEGLDTNFVDWYRPAKKVLDGLYDGVSSIELDTLAAETAASLTSVHPDYAILAGRLAITAHYKETESSFSKTVEKLHKHVHPKTGKSTGLIADDIYDIVMKNREVLDAAIDQTEDMNYSFFGFKTLYNAYLTKINGKPVERIQHLLMRVAVGIWRDNIDEVLVTYRLLSERKFTHATPTLFNAGTRLNQLSSCFLLPSVEDSIVGMYKAAGDMAVISKLSGGIGIPVSSVRATGAYVRGTNGISNGIIPLLKVYNDLGKHVNQGGKRKGSIAVYLEPWHADVYDFLELRKNHGAEDMRARDLFPALWMPDLFFQRLDQDAEWSLFCPDEAPGLWDCFDDRVTGDKTFTELYEKYEQEGRARRKVKAVDLWMHMLESAAETGTPYMLYKDAANSKSNQKNLGTIKSSNLCCEIIEFTDFDEIAVCNLASLALPRFLKVINGVLAFDHEEFYRVTYQVTKNLNKVIDINYYPLPETKKSNMRHRPIGLGVQGFADTLAMLGLDYESQESQDLNKEIFETLYFAAVSSSKDLAKVEGSYDTYPGSPISKGIFQFDMWTDNKVQVKLGKMSIAESNPIALSGRWDWEALRAEVIKHGVRNSLLVAPMPTASTAQILDNNESFEAFTTNLYRRQTLSGEFMMVNKHLVRDLVKIGEWSPEMKNDIISNKGSVQGLNRIPDYLQTRYKTQWEIKQRTMIDMAAARGAFICQSQSMNLFIPNDNKFISTLSTTWQYGFLKGLKTGSYYIRTRGASQANAALGATGMGGGGREETPKFTEEETKQCAIDARENGEDCEACGS